MRFLLIFVYILFQNISAQNSTVSSGKDERIIWLKDNVLPIRSINPEDEDFSDLQPLKDIIGDAKIVLLGEPSHGDGSVFFAKTRIIKFLHKEMGFDVLAFESGLYSCRLAWEYLKEGTNPLNAVRQGINRVWTESQQVQHLFQYIGETVKTDNPLEIAGFDMFSHLQDTAWGLFISELELFLIKNNSVIVSNDNWDVFISSLDSLRTKRDFQIKPSSFFNQLEELQKEVTNISPLDSTQQITKSLFIQLLKTIKAKANYMLAIQHTKDWKTSWNYRDSQMAENFIWLSNELYPDQKIIGWGATVHFTHNIDQIDTQNDTITYDSTITMGQIIWQLFGDEVYTLGFTAYSGQCGWYSGQLWDIEKPTNGSLEDLVNATGIEYALLNFRHLPSSGEWLREKIICRPHGYSEQKADWTQHMDGIMFIREMKPSTNVVK